MSRNAQNEISSIFSVILNNSFIMIERLAEMTIKVWPQRL